MSGGRNQARDAAWLKRAAKRDLAVGKEDDRRWFANHGGRNYRIRVPIGTAERLVTVAQIPPGFTPMILVRQVEPGSRFRATFGWPPSEPLPLNAEHAGEELFRIIFTGADVTIVDLSR